MAASAEAQILPAPPDGRMVFTMGLFVAGGYDDNVFMTPPPTQSSGLFRATPLLEFRYRSERRVSMTASYSLSSEAFTRVPEFNEPIAQQAGAISLDLEVERRTTLSMRSGYSFSHRPAEVFESTGLDFRRSEAENLTTGVSLERRFGRDDRVRVEYGWNRLSFVQGLRVEDTPSEVWRAGWTHPLGRYTSVSFLGGVRNTEGRYDADYNVGLVRTHRYGSWSISYSRSQTPVPSREGSLDRETLSATAIWRLGRDVAVTLTPSASNNASGTERTRAYRLAAGINYAVKPWLGIQASYAGNMQRVDAARVPSALQRDLAHNVILVGAVLSHSFRLR